MISFVTIRTPVHFYCEQHSITQRNGEEERWGERNSFILFLFASYKLTREEWHFYYKLELVPVPFPCTLSTPLHLSIHHFTHLPDHYYYDISTPLMVGLLFTSSSLLPYLSKSIAFILTNT
jgi:hypothetical protein